MKPASSSPYRDHRKNSDLLPFICSTEQLVKPQARRIKPSYKLKAANPDLNVKGSMKKSGGQPTDSRASRLDLTRQPQLLHSIPRLKRHLKKVNLSQPADEEKSLPCRSGERLPSFRIQLHKVPITEASPARRKKKSRKLSSKLFQEGLLHSVTDPSVQYSPYLDGLEPPPKFLIQGKSIDQSQEETNCSSRNEVSLREAVSLSALTRGSAAESTPQKNLRPMKSVKDITRKSPQLKPGLKLPQATSQLPYLVSQSRLPLLAKSQSKQEKMEFEALAGIDFKRTTTQWAQVPSIEHRIPMKRGAQVWVNREGQLSASLPSFPNVEGTQLRQQPHRPILLS